MQIREAKSENMEQAVKHWAITASAGCYVSMKNLMTCFEGGFVNSFSCAEMRSEARDAFIRMYIGLC